MAKTGNYIREENNILKKENTETGYTVRLHFTENNGGNNILEEIQNILIETYIKNLRFKEAERHDC